MRAYSALVSIAVLGFLAPASGSAGEGGIYLVTPQAGQEIRMPQPLVAISGIAGHLPLYRSDVVIAIDKSETALLASGTDVDEDGVVGRTREWAKDLNTSHPWRQWTTDRDDIIIRAEQLAARAAVEKLAERHNQIGVMTFGAEPTVQVQLPVSRGDIAVEAVQRLTGVGSKSRSVNAGLDSPASRGGGGSQAGKNIARALRVAHRMLDDTAESEPRARAVLLFSDGRFTPLDVRYHMTREVDEAAKELADSGIAVYAFAFGEEPDMDLLSGIAEATGGWATQVRQPQALLSDLPQPEAKPLALSIENLTTGEPARAVRNREDGSFDAIASLVPGQNQLEVRAILADGKYVSERRVVHYAESDAESAKDRRRLLRMLLKLRAPAERTTAH